MPQLLHKPTEVTKTTSFEFNFGWEMKVRTYKVVPQEQVMQFDD